VDGIVGFPFFARYRVVLDYQKQEMTFVPVDYRPADIMADMMSMMMAPKDKRPKKALAAAALWGLGVTKADDDRAAGVTVAQVLPGSAADTAGLKAGDRLLVLDGTWTDSLDDCYRATAGVKPGETVTATVRRGDRELTISLTPRAGL
jgi:S1-C subfamily serine protease